MVCPAFVTVRRPCELCPALLWSRSAAKSFPAFGKGFVMRRWLMVLAIGVLWAQAASAQPQSFGEQYAPPTLFWRSGSESSEQYNPGLDPGWPKPVAHDSLLLKRMIGALDVHPEGGKNVDASCLEEVGRRKSLLTWRGLFSNQTSLGRYEPEQPLQFGDGCPCLEILNHLSFFDVLDPAKVGPYWEPWKMPVYLGHRRWEGDEYREIY
jgi:hypothetical protein